MATRTVGTDLDFEGVARPVNVPTPALPGDGVNKAYVDATTPFLVYRARFGDASPVAFAVVPAGRTIGSIEVTVEQPFDGAGSSLQIGTAGDPDAFFGATDADLGEPDATWEKDGNADGPLTLWLTLTPGTSATTGILLITLTLCPTPPL